MRQARSKNNNSPLEIDLEEMSLEELQALSESIDRELEARAFAESLEAQVRMFMRRREG